MKPDDTERRSRDTRPQPAWRGADPATPCKAAQAPPPPAMKRTPLSISIVAFLFGLALPVVLLVVVVCVLSAAFDAPIRVPDNYNWNGSLVPSDLSGRWRSETEPCGASGFESFELVSDDGATGGPATNGSPQRFAWTPFPVCWTNDNTGQGPPEWYWNLTGKSSVSALDVNHKITVVTVHEPPFRFDTFESFYVGGTSRTNLFLWRFRNAHGPWDCVPDNTEIWRRLEPAP